MARYVRSIEGRGIYGRFDLSQRFHPGINVLFGRNGSGKTTLLHILANILNGDYARFAFLTFNSITVELDDETRVTVSAQDRPGDRIVRAEVNSRIVYERSAREIREYEISRQRPGSGELLRPHHEEAEPVLPTAYFPAFRTMIEAWTSLLDEDSPRQAIDEDPWRWRARIERIASSPYRLRATSLARRLFGQFVPEVSYPSPLEIQWRMIEETRRAMLQVGSTDRELLSRAFLRIFASLSGTRKEQLQQSDSILEEIRTLSEKLESSELATQFMPATDVYTELRRLVQSAKVHESEHIAAPILSVYREALRERVEVQERAFEGIERYLASVNEFLEGKRIKVGRQDETRSGPSTYILYDDQSTSHLQALSSGERQIVTMIYAATHMSSQKVVLIDEPEISLHVDWQRSLLKRMSEQLGDRQVIACTHSPVIGADCPEGIMEVVFRTNPTRVPTDDWASDDAERTP